MKSIIDKGLVIREKGALNVDVIFTKIQADELWLAWLPSW